MFSRGLESLLRQKTGTKIIGLETDLERAIKAIKKLNPDVVILDNNTSLTESAPDVMRILKATPEIKVISLNLHNNNLRIYRATKRVARSVDDLVSAIEEEPPLFGLVNSSRMSEDSKNSLQFKS